MSRKTNILDVPWDRPIELLFIDLCKSWKRNDHVTATFCPHLQPGAIVVQRDDMFSDNPWVCSTMDKLRDYVRHAGHADYNDGLDFRDAMACEPYVLRPWPPELPRTVPG